MENKQFVITAMEARRITESCSGRTEDETESEILESIYNRIAEAASHGYEAIKFTVSGDLGNGLWMSGAIKKLADNGFTIEKGISGYLISWK